jgi:FkbM family methyltransferase
MRVVSAQHSAIPVAFPLAVHETGDAYVSESLANSGCWEPFETKVFARVIANHVATTAKPPFVVDGGANLGWYSVVAGLLGAEVLAVEPMPANQALLRSNIERNELDGVVTVCAGALGDQPGRASLHLSATNQGDHRLHSHESHDPTKRKLTVDVAVDTLDHLVGARSADVIKLDTQGSEAAILRGASMHWGVGVGDRTVLLTEFWPYGLIRCGSSADELRSLLAGPLDTTHRGFLVLEQEGVLVPVDINGLALLAASRALSPEVRGFVNVLLIPRSLTSALAGLVDSHRPLPFL